MDGVAGLRTWWTDHWLPGRRTTTRDPNSVPAVGPWLLFALFVATCALFFARLDHPLLEPEEARYAEIPRQMLLEGNFWTPTLHGEDYWQKPPLLYWLVMLSYQVFGVHDWAARLVPCLAGILSVAIVTSWAHRALGFWTGLVSGAMLTLSARFLYLGGMLTMDGLLCTCILGSLASGHLAITEDRRWRWIVLSALACGLGVLTKGPVALILVAVPLGALALFDRRARMLTWIESACYLALVMLVAGPWYLMMALNAPEAAESFWLLHNLTRYVAPFDHEKPAWFYVPSLLLGMLPWTVLVIPLTPYLWRRSPCAGRHRPAALGVLLLAFAWCVLFFSFSGCKRPAYILPAFPLGAMILATFVTHGLPWQRWMQHRSACTQRIDRVGRRWSRALLTMTLVMGAAISTAAAAVNLWPWTASAFASGLFALVWLLLAFPPKRAPAWTTWVGSAAFVFLVLFFAQRAWLPDYHDRFGLRRQVEISAAYEQEETMPIVTYPKRWDSISFYTKRDDVQSFTPAQIAQLSYTLRAHGKALVFVRRDGSLKELQQALPERMELELLGRQGAFVSVGVVRWRPEGR